MTNINHIPTPPPIFFTHSLVQTRHAFVQTRHALSLLLLLFPLLSFAQRPQNLDKHRSTQHFRVHYTLDGENRPAGIQANTQAAEHYVFMVQHYLEEAYQKLITERNYKTPITDGEEGGGNDLYDIYIQGIPIGENGQTKADPPSDYNSSQTSTYIVISNQLPLEDIYGGNALAATATHEFFHAIQNAYYCSALAAHSYAAIKTAKSSSLREGTAVWAETLLSQKDQQAKRFPNKNYYSYLNTSPGLLTYPAKALLVHEEAHASQYAYSTVFFWLYLSEQFGEDIIQKIWEANAVNDKQRTSIEEEMNILDELLAEAGGLQTVIENFYIALYLLQKDATSYMNYQKQYPKWILKEHHFYQQFTQKKRYLPALSPEHAPISTNWDCQQKASSRHCELEAMGGLGIHHISPPDTGKYLLKVTPLLGTPALQTNDLIALLLQETANKTIQTQRTAFEISSNQLTITFEHNNMETPLTLFLYRLSSPELAQLAGKNRIQYQISLQKSNEY